MDSKKLAKIAYEALDDKKGIDITVIDISQISVLADYFVIAGGSNEKQVKALAGNVEEEMAKEKISARHMEGYNASNWVLMDFGDIIVHIFNQDDRLFYDLERIWSDGKTVDINEL